MNPALTQMNGQGAAVPSIEDGVVATLYVHHQDTPASTLGTQAEVGEQVFTVMELYAPEHGESQWARRYWRIPHGAMPIGSPSGHRRIKVEIPEENAGAPGDGTTVGEYLPGVFEVGTASAPVRGTVVVRPRRKVLFSTEMSLAPGALPRRRPHVFIDERDLVDEEDV